MAEQQKSNSQDNQVEEQGELTEAQVAQVQEIATQAVRTALAEAARQENLSPADRMREGYAANRPAA